jgi:hypothetical protein
MRPSLFLASPPTWIWTWRQRNVQARPRRSLSASSSNVIPGRRESHKILCPSYAAILMLPASSQTVIYALRLSPPDPRKNVPLILITIRHNSCQNQRLF